MRRYSGRDRYGVGTLQPVPYRPPTSPIFSVTNLTSEGLGWGVGGGQHRRLLEPTDRIETQSVNKE